MLSIPNGHKAFMLLWIEVRQWFVYRIFLESHFYPATPILSRAQTIRPLFLSFIFLAGRIGNKDEVVRGATWDTWRYIREFNRDVIMYRTEQMCIKQPSSA